MATNLPALAGMHNDNPYAQICNPSGAACSQSYDTRCKGVLTLMACVRFRLGWLQVDLETRVPSHAHRQRMVAGKRFQIADSMQFNLELLTQLVVSAAFVAAVLCQCAHRCCSGCAAKAAVRFGAAGADTVGGYPQKSTIWRCEMAFEVPRPCTQALLTPQSQHLW